jgi:TonB family protein
VFPAEAQAKRIQGIVIMEATIDELGKVHDVKVLRSVPELDTAAVDAVKQWEFTPTVIDDVPTPIIMNVTVNFTLNNNNALPSSRREPPGPLEVRAIQLGLRLQSPPRTAGDLPPYPTKVKDGARGVVTLSLTVDEEGRVREVRSLADVRENAGKGQAPLGPLGDAFVDASIKAVKQWRYPEPAQSPVTYEVRFRFVPGQPVEAM